MEAHSGQNYLINVMLCLSNVKVFVVIFVLCACNIIWHIINFMLYIYIGYIYISASLRSSTHSLRIRMTSYHVINMNRSRLLIF